jgi:type IV secretory pathway VirJ component
MRTLLRRPLVFLGLLLVGVTTSQALATLGPQTRDSVAIRGQQQTVSIYGRRGGQPIVVTSGDGGWIHLGPVVAEYLASQGFFVVGFDARAYLEGFTSGHGALKPADEPGDFRVLADWAAQGASRKPILIGVSEGAGLSLLAATDPATKTAIAGVIGLGLPNTNELGWRWKDAVIYLTHGVPNEPTFSTAALADRVSPLPLAAIHSTRDEFVPIGDVQRVIDAAREPKRLWIIEASDHRFSDNMTELERRLLEAIAWVNGKSPR